MVPAQTADVDEIVTLVESVYRGESSQKGWTTEARLLEGQRVDASMVQEMIANPHSALLVFKDDGKIKACVYLERKNQKAVLGMLSVDVDQQGNKLGQKIIKFSENFIANNWKVASIQIYVLWQREELISWYERRGFKKTGVEKPFPKDPKFGIPKVKDLHFIEMEKAIA